MKNATKKFDVTILDTETGEKRRAIDYDFGKYDALWWAEGNGSCDCNRAIIFGVNDEMDRQQHIDFPELEEHQSYCFRSNRFLIVESDPCEFTLDELNAEYPQELKDKYIKTR